MLFSLYFGQVRIKFSVLFLRLEKKKKMKSLVIPNFTLNLYLRNTYIFCNITEFKLINTTFIKFNVLSTLYFI